MNQPEGQRERRIEEHWLHKLETYHRVLIASASPHYFALTVLMSRWHIPGYPQPRAPPHLLLCGIIHIDIEQRAQVGQMEDGQGPKEQV